jgi:hypothetical protein
MSGLSVSGPDAVTLGFLWSAEYRGNQVHSYYSSLLHRQTAPSADEVSLWVNSSSDLTDIRVGFESSYEFFLNG